MLKDILDVADVQATLFRLVEELLGAASSATSAINLLLATWSWPS